MSWRWGWRPYVSVGSRRAQAAAYAKKLEKKGTKLEPVSLAGRKITTTFWGNAWCDNLESYSDFANRLPRGRSYVRNGSVIDLQISAGEIAALVSGSDIYKVKIKIDKLGNADWKQIVTECAQSIDSLMDLLQGRLSEGVMERLTRQREGLFPQPREIKLSCSCPDWAVMCKHVAAVLYGVGARLDSRPELLFLLRHVDHAELVSRAVDSANLETAFNGSAQNALNTEDLGAVFGIDLETATPEVTAPAPTKTRRGVKPVAAKKKSSSSVSADSKSPAVKLPHVASVATTRPAAKTRRTRPRVQPK